ncbi:MAG: putrescine transport system substrate-binding protein [Cycloclasticus sp.]|jgi:putrescine transport system substrate-binding protein
MNHFRINFTVLLFLLSSQVFAAQPSVNIYNWNDYFAEDTLAQFEAATGIKPVLDLYDSNETLEAKLLAGHSGYDLVFPTARPFGARHIRAGIYQLPDRAKLSGWKNLDTVLLASLEDIDAGNKYLVPYMWGTTGLGINTKKVRAILGDGVPADSWALVFDPTISSKLKSCGISLMDDSTEVFAAALSYLGKDPNSIAMEDLDAAQALLVSARPNIRYFHSSQYISDLANGDTCVAHAYSGDVLQARDRAAEANNGVVVGYIIPKEGAVLWVDVMAIPVDAPHPEQAMAFIDFMLTPSHIAAASNYVNYANANSAATELLDEGVRHDPGIYPPDAVMKKLFVLKQRSDKDNRSINRRWTRIKANR